MKKLLFLLAFIPTLLFGQTPPIYNVLGAGNNANSRSLIGLSLIGLRGSSSGTVTVQGPAVITTYTFTLPPNDGTSGQYLQTDGNGVTSWATISTGLTVGTTAIASGTSDYVLFQGAGNVLQQSANFQWIQSSSKMSIGQPLSVDARLEVKGTSILVGDRTLKLTNSGDVTLFDVRNNGVLVAGDPTNQNLFLGLSCGLNNAPSGSDGTTNTGVGYEVLKEQRTGETNTGFGFRALRDNQSGDGNTAMGGQALMVLQGGNFNTAIGDHAGESVSTGVNNTLLGAGAGKIIGAGGYNVIVGNNAFALGNNASDNTVVGAAAGAACVTGQLNTFVGSSNANKITGNNNTVVGAEAAFNTTGANGTYFGYGAGYHETGAGKLYITPFKWADEATGRASALLYGEHNSTVASQILTTNSSFGIGVAPTARLHVKGLGATGATYWIKGENASGTSMMQGNNAGQVAFNSSIGSNGFDIQSIDGGVSTYKSLNVGSTLGSNMFVVEAAGNVQIYKKLFINFGTSPQGFGVGDNFCVHNNTNMNVKIGEYAGVSIIESINDAHNADVPLYLYGSELYLYSKASVNTTAFVGSEKFRVNGSVNVTGDIQLSTSGRILPLQGADVASLNGGIALGADGNTFEITGTNSITGISNSGWQNGAEVDLVFTGAAVLVDGTANSGTDIGFELEGNTNFTASADDVVTLKLCEIGGVQRWRMKSKSVN